MGWQRPEAPTRGSAATVSAWACDEKVIWLKDLVHVSSTGGEFAVGPFKTPGFLPNEEATLSKSRP